MLHLPMKMNTFFNLVVLFNLTFFGLSIGYDPFQSPFTESCFESIPIEGCNGTLLQNFVPKSEGAARLNEPDTKFFLFTPRNKFKAEFLHECGGSLPDNTNFDPLADTEILISGYFDNACRTTWMREMRDEYFKRGSYNLIMVYWAWGSTFDYTSTILNAPIIGEQLAFLIENIMRKSGVQSSSFHLVGHSIGAHIAGFVGQIVKNIGRITGLDPAGPGYQNSPPEQRLDAKDATVVDVIYSSSTDCTLLGFGLDKPTGQANFYPNGGSVQLSCYGRIFPAIFSGDFLSGFSSFLPPLCSHLQSLQYYKVSINPGSCQFVGVECPSYAQFKLGGCNSCGRNGTKCAVMGLDYVKYRPNDDKIRSYYLDTTFKCPYCDNDMYQKFERSLKSKF